MAREVPRLGGVVASAAAGSAPPRGAPPRPPAGRIRGGGKRGSRWVRPGNNYPPFLNSQVFWFSARIVRR